MRNRAGAESVRNFGVEYVINEGLRWILLKECSSSYPKLLLFLLLFHGEGRRRCNKLSQERIVILNIKGKDFQLAKMNVAKVVINGALGQELKACVWVKQLRMYVMFNMK